MKFIIEHCEPIISPWSLLEYEHASKIVGKDNLIFTNTKEDCLKKLGHTYEKSISKLSFNKIIVLDPEAEQELTPNDSSFDYCVIGGILGDNPPLSRTKELITSKFKCETRHLGTGQFSVDNAVLVAKLILIDKKNLNEIKTVQGIEIKINKIESVILDFAYPIINGKTIITPGLKKFLKELKEF